MTVMLRAADVSVDLAGNRIVERATLDLEAGELTLLVGPNGAGKTTLMRALAGLLPSEGRIELEGRPLGAFSARERARRIAYLPQGHVFHWPMSEAAYRNRGGRRRPRRRHDRGRLCAALDGPAGRRRNVRPLPRGHRRARRSRPAGRDRGVGVA